MSIAIGATQSLPPGLPLQIRTPGASRLQMPWLLAKEALRLASRIVALEAGGIVQDDPPLEPMQWPGSRGCKTCWRRRWPGGTDRHCGWRPGLAGAGGCRGGSPGLCGIRTENVSLGRKDGGMADSRAGTLREVAALGPLLRVTLDRGFPLVSYFIGEVHAALALRPGQTLRAGFEPGAVHPIGPPP
jgi:ABC-type Fe3+/spermidine/putrescine transport system ATPase subunit